MYSGPTRSAASAFDICQTETGKRCPYQLQEITDSIGELERGWSLPFFSLKGCHLCLLKGTQKKKKEKRKRTPVWLQGSKQANAPQTKQAIAPQNSISKAVEAGSPLL